MPHFFDKEINLICVGDVLSGKSSFLEDYTKCRPDREQAHYKVYPLESSDKSVVFLHEVQ